MIKKLYILLMIMLLPLGVAAGDNIRYVSKAGSYTNDGTSWEKAKLNIQDAINDLVDKGELPGEVWVAEGTYTPTESTESSGGSVLNMSFKIPAGITVRGGFKGTEEKASDRVTTNHENLGLVYGSAPTYVSKTVLSGDVSGKSPDISWNASKNQYSLSFYGNSYHVVWFATNGFDDDGHANALDTSIGIAKIEGCTIENGNAQSTLTKRSHIAYGGGVYMVEGSVLENCNIMNCQASRDGGGVYMDGGGTMIHCTVTVCQALGLGVDYGYGGGVCIYGNGSTTPVGIQRSGIAGCVGRLGGGLAIQNGKVTISGSDNYLAYASSVLVANNTAKTEGGGVYTENGGALSHMTIVRNKCVGTGVITNGMTTGRSAGLYCRDNAVVVNSVMWGGQCDANNDVEYASSRSEAKASLMPQVQFCAMSHGDYIDWSGTSKYEVSKLSDYNTKADATAAGAKVNDDQGYPMFLTPYSEVGCGDNAYMALLSAVWRLSAQSSINKVGIETYDLDRDNLTPITTASQDILGNTFNPHCSLGAYTVAGVTIAPKINGVVVEFFVDPNDNGGSSYDNIGSTWDKPIRFLGDVLWFIKENAATTYSGKTFKIYVKQGTCYNTNSYSTQRVRLSSLDIPSNTTLLGSYSSALTGTDLTSRNPLLTPTILNGNVTDDYDVNVAHLVSCNGTKNSTIDGFKIRYANASSTEMGNPSKNGAAMNVYTTSVSSIPSLTVKNCLFAGNTANKGAAVNIVSGQVAFENCIFHNNTCTVSDETGIISVNANCTATFDHCDFLRNVGHAICNNGTVTMNNSVCYGNMSEAVDDTNGNDDKAVTTFVGSATPTGSNNLFDSQTNISGMGSSTLSYSTSDTNNYPRFINSTKNAGVTPNGDVTYYGRGTSFQPHNENPMVNAASYSGDYSTWGTDMSTITMRTYGGLPDIGAVENHEATKTAEGENAYTDGQPAYGSVTYVRDYRQADGTTIDTSTEGRDGSSWAKAINGNADYTVTGTQTSYVLSPPAASSAIDASDKMVYKIAMLAGGTTSGTPYYAYNASGDYLTSTTSQSQGDNYVLVSTGTANQYYIYNVTKGKYCYYTDTSEGKGKVQLAETNTSNATWWLHPYTEDTGELRYLIIPGSLNYGDYQSAQSWNYHGGVGNNLGFYPGYNDGNGKWGFYLETTEEVNTNVKGLQYAVNNANVAFYSAGSKTSDVKEVWVGAGTYSKDPETGDQSCYIIKDGVDVYGAFPKTGNPGKDQRQALVSTHVKVTSSYSPADYETILQPATTTIEAGATRRVLGQPYDNNPNKSGYTDYVEATWDGFTLQNGVYDAAVNASTQSPSRCGGAGAAYYKNVTLRNVVVTNNTTIYNGAGATQDFRAGGIYMDGGTLEEGYVINNVLEGWSNGAKSQNGAAYGGGMYIYSGTVFNSVIANNLDYSAYADGAGLFIENANFFNNTIVNNKAEGSLRACGGVAIWQSGESSTLTVYNSIIMKNEGIQLGVIGTKDVAVQNGGRINLYNCLSETNENLESGTNKITFTNCQTTTDAVSLFDTYNEYSERSETNFSSVNLRLKSTASSAINKGIDSPEINGVTYNLEDYTDMDYADRVQDCAIDIGAYEFNGSVNITPDLTSESDKAIFYVTPNGKGTASADSPTNAACAAKLQKVLDAAGRYKYANPGTRVIVKVANEITEAGSAGTQTYRSPNFDASDLSTISANGQYLTALSMSSTQSGATTATSTSLFADKTAPTSASEMYILASPASTTYVKAGEEVTFTLTFPSYQTSQILAATVWFDKDGDGNFETNLGQTGTAEKSNDLTMVKATIPTDSYNKATRIRLRLDSSWEIASAADDDANRMVYDIPVTVWNGENNTESTFSYYACRTTDDANSDVRVWSIMIPRGVEVWGGYTSEYTDANNNGFYTKTTGTGPTYTDNRNILGNKTTFDSYYYNKSEASEAYTYHVCTFTDNVFDTDGNAISGELMSQKTTDRAVLDGIFITGGKADANTTSASSTNIYGGAALVTDYAHVRNCIVRNNTGDYGGALALTKGALVSGCLIDQNTAKNNGGGIYVLTDEQNSNLGVTSTEKPRVYTSTIVNNKASKIGGGLWFDGEDDVRVSSTVIWQNSCNDMANVAGNYNPERASATADVEDSYPFAYSAVENIRVSGTNNISVATANKNGVRFADKSNASDNHKTMAEESDFSDYGYYMPTSYSILLSTGMPLKQYTTLVSSVGLAANDFAAKDRGCVQTGMSRTYVDIGARALEKTISLNQLMLRLFVAQAADVDMDAAETMMNLTGEANSVEEYYAQEGSSFAYPFQSLQDALDYIYANRDATVLNSVNNHANNLPFEIFMAKGTYYPTRDLAGNYGESLSNTFAIPEGVRLYGGYSVNHGTSESKKFYGRYWKENYSDSNTDISNNRTAVDALTDDKIGGITIEQKTAQEMNIGRAHNDNNGNNIIEPWEFTNQTILSGNATNSTKDGVYHVITIVPDENIVGVLPKSKSTNSAYTDATAGTTYCERGQDIELNGIQIEGGHAYEFDGSQMDDYSKYNYYHGGGLMADGNRYCNNYNDSIAAGSGSPWTHENTTYKNQSKANAVAYRNIPLCIVKCNFYDNDACYGGAVSTNMTTEIFSSRFEKNLAVNKSETVTMADGSTINATYPGQGGAIYSTYQLSAYNTLLANNEARDEANIPDLKPWVSPRNPGSAQTYGGCGGAIYSGRHGHFHIMNSDIVRNRANVFPAVYTMNPNALTDDMKEDKNNAGIIDIYNQIINSVVWGNELKSDMSLTEDQKFAASLICNYRTSNSTDSYNAALTPTSQDDLDANKGTVETAWFTAYEDGRGITANNDVDMRAVNVNPVQHCIYTLSNVTKSGSTTEMYPYQNCNTTIDSENSTLDGPNFVSPATAAGVDGYVEGADWSLSRINKLVDKGSGRIMQKYDSSTKKYSFPSYTEAGVTRPDRAYSIATDDDYVTDGVYTNAKYINGYPNFNANLPLGTDLYMDWTDGSTTTAMHRISFDPTPTRSYAYIDLGVYEYIHSPLTYSSEGDEVDILWVSPKEKPENGVPDGKTWKTPTSDLQRAIETLLSSRNGHRKEIRLMNGTYSPLYTIDDKMAFYVNTYNLNSQVVLPSGDNNTGLGIKSFTIKGGYSQDLNGMYNVETYPAIIRQQTRTETTTTDRWDHLIYIKDASQRYGENSYTEANGYGWWHTSDEQSREPDPKTIPIEIDGVTLINDQASANVDGAALYYAPQKFTDYVQDNEGTVVANGTTSANISMYNDKGQRLYYTSAEKTATQTTKTDYPAYVEKSSPAKLIMSKCKVMTSGYHNVDDNDNANRSTSAVYLGTGGGTALIYNSVFNSNYGKPLVSACDATTIHNTFGNNGGTTDLTDGSTITNSVFWENNSTGTDTYGNQFKGATTTVPTYTAYTGATDDATTNHIASLSNTNNDVLEGPNFINPNLGEESSYNLKPSMKLLNTANDEAYVTATKSSSSYTIYDYAWEATDTLDAAGNPRKVYSAQDLGAYEYQNQLYRVVYYDPNQEINGTGDSWASPFGHGHFQDAIDLAALYVGTSTSSDDNKFAYVFAKGGTKVANGYRQTDEAIIPREGVQVYASIPAGYTTSAELTDVTGDDSEGTKLKKQTNEITSYLTTIYQKERSGLLAPSAARTIVKGISSSGYYSTKAVVDGMYVDGDVSLKANSTTANKVAVVNSAIMSSSSHVTLSGGLLYDALVTGDVTVSGSGYACNVTATGNITNSANVINSIPNYAGSGYEYEDSPLLNYQLKESDETNIDNATDPTTAFTDFGVINYTTDRDVLGNPRKLGTAVDKGAFETWKISSDLTATYQGETLPRTVESTKYYTPSKVWRYFPHEGSNVYLSDALVLDGTIKTAGYTFTPGFLLVGDGGSLYGQDNTVNCSWVSVERSISADGNVVALPYAHKYATADDDESATAYIYKGDTRSASSYNFSKSDSPCWEAIDDDVITAANKGVFFKPSTAGTIRFTSKGETSNDYIYKESADSTYRTVRLLSYDDSKSTDGKADFTSAENQGWNCIGIPYLVSDYKPYLGSDGSTYSSSSSAYMMNIPHTLWLYYDGKTYSDGTTNVNGDGGYYSVSSWDNSDWHITSGETPRLWVGEGIFTQTAAVSRGEDLVFYRPVYIEPNPSKANKSGKESICRNVRYYLSEGVEDRMEAVTDITISANGSNVVISNLKADDVVTIFTADGMKHLETSGITGTYSHQLPDGMYIVIAGNATKKIMIR